MHLPPLLRGFWSMGGLSVCRSSHCSARARISRARRLSTLGKVGGSVSALPFGHAIGRIGSARRGRTHRRHATVPAGSWPMFCNGPFETRRFCRSACPLLRHVHYAFSLIGLSAIVSRSIAIACTRVATTCAQQCKRFARIGWQWHRIRDAIQASAPAGPVLCIARSPRRGD